jgi:hypothetical protein
VKVPSTVASDVFWSSTELLQLIYRGKYAEATIDLHEMFDEAAKV